ncbi:MAG: DUF1097 domain-containing protein [Flavobacterium johnsoniae]|jgi:hypothetical protein|nr:MAG: DUF1097 domain-containing protein [Flavobacterium johnsoniae]
MKSFFQALTLGILAGMASLITFLSDLPTWILFLGWTSYFLFGQKTKSFFYVYTQQLIGVLLAILIIYLGNFLSERLGSQWFHCSVFVILFSVFYVTKLKVFNDLTAYFLGMIIWFGLATDPTLEKILIVAVTLFTGFLSGWINLNLNKRIETKLK